MILNLRHLELMHHYVTKTSLTLINVDEDRGMWQEGVPIMAISNDFLMHSIWRYLHFTSSISVA
jgi:hypothetical protein